MIFTVANVGLTIGLGTLIAFLLIRVSSWVRVLLTAGLVLAWSMPAVVAVQVWFWMTNFQNGILNYVLTELGIGDFAQHDWYETTFSKLAMVTLLIVWGAIPFVTITVYAGLAQVPRELVEAAEIDGAGPLRVFRDVTFPILKPIFLILTSLSIIWDFGVFTQPYLLIGASQVDPTNYLMGVYVFIEALRAERLRARRGDLAADAAHRRDPQRLLRAADGEDGGGPVSAVAPRPAAQAPRAAASRSAGWPGTSSAWRCSSWSRLPGVLDGLDGVQARRRDQQLHADVALAPSRRCSTSATRSRGRTSGTP